MGCHCDHEGCNLEPKENEYDKLPPKKESISFIFYAFGVIIGVYSAVYGIYLLIQKYILL